MKYRIICGFFCICLLIPLSLQAEADTTSTAIEFLEKENAQLKAEKSDLISILQWSLGSILVIIVALFGSSYLFTFRLNKKELDNIEAGFALKIKELMTNFGNEINANVKEDSNALVGRFQKQLDEFNLNYRQQIDNLQTSFSTQIHSMEKTNEDRSESLKTEIRGTEDRLKKLLKSTETELQAYVYRVEHYMWKTREVWVNALWCLLSEAEIYFEKNNNGMIELCTKDIINVIETIVEHETELSKYDKESIIKFSEKLPESLNVEKNKLLEIIDNVKIRM